MKWTTEKPTIEGPYVVYIPEWHYLDDGRWSCKWLCTPDAEQHRDEPDEPYWDDDGEAVADDLEGTWYMGPLPIPKSKEKPT